MGGGTSSFAALNKRAIAAGLEPATVGSEVQRSSIEPRDHLWTGLSYVLPPLAGCPWRRGEVAERSKALRQGRNLFGGVGSNPTPGRWLGGPES